MIDSDGYRLNVGIIICNNNSQVLWAKRHSQNSWQFPQGGVDEGETLEDTMFRELYEEVGLKPHHVKILARTLHWCRYQIPNNLIRRGTPPPVCIGQKQRWFLLQLVTNEENIKFDNCEHPEFDDWRWVSYWYPIRQVISFKKEIYQSVLIELSGYTFSLMRGKTK